MIYHTYFMYLVYGSLILFIGMIGSILITCHIKKYNHLQDIKNQIHIDLVKIKSKKHNK